MDYYDKFANEFFERSVSADLEEMYRHFLPHVTRGGKILDIGAGSGRDILHFRQQGYEVLGLEPFRELAALGRSYSGGEIVEVLLENTDFNSEFDGVWACASLLHFRKVDLPHIFQKIEKALKKDGALYCSFKAGHFEGIREQRYFTDLSKQELKRLIEENTELVAQKIWTSHEERDSESIQWINGLFIK